MPRIALRLHGPATVSNVAATKYTVPANRKGIVRHIHASNPSAGIISFTMSIGADGAGVRVYDGFPIAADSVLDAYPIYVLEEAEIIQAFTDGAGGILVLTIDGDESVLG